MENQCIVTTVPSPTKSSRLCQEGHPATKSIIENRNLTKADEEVSTLSSVKKIFISFIIFRSFDMLLHLKMIIVA